MKPKTCPTCKKKFEPYNYKTRFCSIGCVPKKEPKAKQCSSPTCENEFTPLLSTQKYCSSKCLYENKKSRLNGKTAKIKPISGKQKKLQAKYLKLRIEFLERLENQRCPVFPKQRATTVHHKMGRKGFADGWAEENEVPLLLDTRFWLAASMAGHEYIEQNPIWAKRKGFSLNRIGKN